MSQNLFRASAEELETMRILLVEDEPDVAAMLAKGLREQAHAVDVADDGEQALDLSWHTPYDLVILDWMLPGKSGFVVCREMREAGFSAPILMLTARDSVTDRVSGLDAGADDYLVKPFHFEEVLARIRALGRRGPELYPDVIAIGNLKIDTKSHEVACGGRVLELTAKEYGLLEYLARHAGEVVGRADISEHVWSQTYDPFSNSIEVYIRRLRAKIGDDGSTPMIRTRRGEGYILGADAESDDD